MSWEVVEEKRGGLWGNGGELVRRGRLQEERRIVGERGGIEEKIVREEEEDGGGLWGRKRGNGRVGKDCGRR